MSDERSVPERVLLLVFAGRTAVRRGEPWAWKALALAVGTWFLLDTSISMTHGVWENAALNVVIALAVLVPTLALRISRPPAPS